MVKVAVAGEPWESNRVLENQKASELLMNVFIDLLEAGYRKVLVEYVVKYVILCSYKNYKEFVLQLMLHAVQLIRTRLSLLNALQVS